MSMITRVATLLIALFAAGPASGQTGYPARPVRVVVPFAPGGPSDVIARLLAQKFSESLGQQFYVENHAGGGGNLGTALAARTAPDGYTMLVASSSFMINPGLYAKIPYDPYTDFDPVTEIATTPNVLVVHPSVAVKSVRELVELIRANPGKYSYANPGTGTPSHLSGEMFKLALKLDMVAVPFQGGGPMIQSVIGGHTPIAFSSMPPAAPQIREGRLRALAVTSGRRSIAVPDVPTMAEAGVADQEGDTPQGILLPRGAPREAIDLLYRETVRVIALSDIKQKLAAIGFEPIGSTPAEFDARIRTEVPKWAKLIREANIKPE
jgi:tripartite-type tricarboxylate transporter receptor subunit TctC